MRGHDDYVPPFRARARCRFGKPVLELSFTQWPQFLCLHFADVVSLCARVLPLWRARALAHTLVLMCPLCTYVLT